MRKEITTEELRDLASQIYEDTLYRLKASDIDLNLLHKEILKQKTVDGVRTLTKALKIEETNGKS